MSLDDVRRVADAVLYEGYILYPYRASAQKNRSRWQFGVLMPPATRRPIRRRPRPRGPNASSPATAQPSVDVHRQVPSGAAAGPPGPRGAGHLGRGGRDARSRSPWRAPRCSATAPPRRSASRAGEEHEATADGDVIRVRRALRGVVTVRATELPGPWQAARPPSG